jgi:hypothetical protein
MRDNFTHFAAAKKSASGFIGFFTKKRMASPLLNKILELVLTARAT